MLWSMLTKNQLVDIKITDQGKTGDGVGFVDEMPIYTPNCIPGDRVQVKIVKVEKRHAYGKLISVLTPSLDWVEPTCLVAATCGGCQLQHQSHDAQLVFKQVLLDRLNRFIDLDDVECSIDDSIYIAIWVSQ